jgi:hypothetical protein
MFLKNFSCLSYLSFLFLIILNFEAYPSTHQNEFAPLKLSTYLQSFNVFPGDCHGDFEGNLVAILGDGSAWKIHPDDQEKMTNWEIGDLVHISLRTSFYWFKREHKFLLCNHDKGMAVKVMIIQYAEAPLRILTTSDTYSTNMIEIEEYIGNDLRGYPIFEEEIIPTDFKKDIRLSDGTNWRIEEKFEIFSEETAVYMGLKETEEGIDRFLICGNQREAIWTWIKPYE